MSVAKRDVPNSPDPAQPNEDEGRIVQRNGDRQQRTNQALLWAKTGINEAKLFVYAKTGQINESEDPEDIAYGLKKLETYREQLSRLLHNAENWTKSLLQTWNYQTNLIDSLNECDKVIQTFHDKPEAPEPVEPEQKLNAVPDALSPNANESHFGQILRGISIELLEDQQESEKRYGHASNLLVVPLRNILSHEVEHAMDLKKRYVLIKRQFDACCTSIETYKAKIHELEHPKEEEPEQGNEPVNAFNKFKIGFGKLIEKAAPTKEELQDKLAAARGQLTEIIKVFEHCKMQFIEALDIVEQKMNVEVVYYVQQFFQFMRQCKSGSISPLKSSPLKQQNEEEKVDDIADSALVQATKESDQSLSAGPQDNFAKYSQIDMEEVALSSPAPNNPTDD